MKHIATLSKYSFAVAIFMMFPTISSAWFTTAQSAVYLNPETVLHTVTYRFGSEKYDFRMPIAASRGQLADSTLLGLEYVLLNEQDEILRDGESSSIVLSTARIVDGAYTIARGDSATFMLVSFTKLPKDFALTHPDTDVSLQVTSLPFTMISTKDEIQGKLNPSELQYYRTPEADALR